MTVELAALEVEEQASSSAVVDKSSVGGRIFVGMESTEQFSGRTSPPTVGILTTCGDATCHLGEEVTVDPVTGEEQGCAPDCPIVLGDCGAPGSSEVGNPEAECGGFGYCNRAAQVCVCAEGYGGDACEYCTDGYLRAPGNGVDYEVCEINVSALKSSGQTAPPPPQTAGRGISPEVRPAYLKHGLNLQRICWQAWYRRSNTCSPCSQLSISCRLAPPDALFLFILEQAFASVESIMAAGTWRRQQWRRQQCWQDCWCHHWCGRGSGSHCWPGLGDQDWAHWTAAWQPAVLG